VRMTEIIVPRVGQPLASTRRRMTTAAAALVAGGAVLLRYHGSAAGWVAALAAAVLVVLSVIDLEQRRVPNRIVVPAAAVVLAGRIALDPSRAWVWAVASLGAALLFFVLAILSPSGLGMGDVKLVLLMGAALGGAIIPALLVGTLAAAVYGVGLMVRYGAGAGRRTMAYVPFLASGALLALLLLRP
jgi:leader peptidase (prepilin peptidase)/N-methyltransferase